MTAKDMFEELGYKLEASEENSRLYCRDILDEQIIQNKVFNGVK